MTEEQQKNLFKCIICAFETGKPTGGYGTLNRDLNPKNGDPGGPSYGRYQFSQKSGHLYNFLKGFVAKNKICDGPYFDAYMIVSDKYPGTKVSMNGNREILAALRTLGSCKEMQEAQEEYFDIHFYAPALAKEPSFKRPLSKCVLLDSFVHGAYDLIKKKIPKGLDEEVFIKEYCEKRKAWLMGNSIPILQSCIYRPSFFLEQIKDGNWELIPPFSPHGCLVTSMHLCKPC